MSTAPTLDEGMKPADLDKQRQRKERDQQRQQRQQAAERRRAAEQRLQENPRPAGFVTVIQENGVPVLGYRPQPNKAVEAVVPMPSRNAQSYVHVPTGSLIDLGVQTPIVTTHADEEDVRVAYDAPQPEEVDDQETMPPVQA